MSLPKNLVVYYDSESHGKRRYLRSVSPKEKSDLWSYEKNDAVLLDLPQTRGAALALTVLGYSGLRVLSFSPKNLVQFQKQKKGFDVIEGGGLDGGDASESENVAHLSLIQGGAGQEDVPQAAGDTPKPEPAA